MRRCGIYEYRRADGSTRRELALPEHVFDPESLKTLGNVALTAYPPAGHPPELVSPDNAVKYAAGHVHAKVDAVEADDEHDFGYVQVRLTGRTRAAVDKMTGQSKLWTSPGYLLPKYDATPGIHEKWGPYDAIQGPAIFNHVALTDSPRGGDRMAVHLDSVGADFAVQTFDSAPLAPQTPPREVPIMAVKIRLDSNGREIEVDPVGAEILQQEFARRDAEGAEAKKGLARYEAMKSELDAMRTKIDEALAAMEKGAEPAPESGDKVSEPKMDALPPTAPLSHRLDRLITLSARRDGRLQAERQAKAEALKRVDAAEAQLKNPAKLRELMAPRVALETQARSVLPQDQHARVDSMSDDEIRRSVIGVVLPQVKLDAEIKGDRLTGLYEGAVANIRTDAGTRTPPPAQTKDAHTPQANGDGQSLAAQQRARIDSDYIPPGGRRSATT